ncbi:MAG: hypothetical protein HY812_00420 [Planctomycetes bacterium]|nr:hypothetical protein [Planctomycetota bacterium]
MTRPDAARPLALLVLLLATACSSAGDPQDVEGIGMAGDEVFRCLELPDADPVRVYDVARALLRVHFAGGRLIEDPVGRRLEVLPRAFSSSPRRLQVFLEVLPAEQGTRVEIFCKVDELRDDVAENPAEPWRFAGRDAELENLLLHEIWDEVVVRPAEGR